MQTCQINFAAKDEAAKLLQQRKVGWMDRRRMDGWMEKWRNVRGGDSMNFNHHPKGKLALHFPLCSSFLASVGSKDGFRFTKMNFHNPK